MRLLTIILISLMCVCTIAGCSGRKMYQAPAISAPIRAHDTEVRRAVRAALLNRGWSIEHDWVEATYARFSQGRYGARVRMRYVGNRVYIEYVSSQYLKYRMKKGQPVIHKLYNLWVRELEDEIHVQISNIHPHGANGMLAVHSENIHPVGYISGNSYSDVNTGSFAGEIHHPPVSSQVDRFSRIDVQAKQDGDYAPMDEAIRTDKISETDIIPSRMIQHNPRRTNPSGAVGSSRGAVNLDEIYY